MLVAYETSLRSGSGKRWNLLRQGKRRLLFVNKKKQKNFMNLGHGRCPRQRPWPSITKVFAPLFSKNGHFPPFKKFFFFRAKSLSLPTICH
ncbi:hypothetical protein [Acidocella sp.]|uniref:hypothetical protein n=1 Tax=Acidocella sp. TaxID=50710 RepID=UPI002F41F7AB